MAQVESQARAVCYKWFAQRRADSECRIQFKAAQIRLCVRVQANGTLRINTAGAKLVPTVARAITPVRMNAGLAGSLATDLNKMGQPSGPVLASCSR